MTVQAVPTDKQLHSIRLPPGFHVSLYASNLPQARSLTWGDNGTLFVGTRGDKVYAVDQHRTVHTIATGLNSPNGVAFRDGALYVAEIHRLIRFDDIETHLMHPPEPQVVGPGFPHDQHHGWKFIAFGPDGLLYIPQGAPCNVCRPDLPYAALSRGQPQGPRDVFARGIRNTVGFDWHPVTHTLWFTDNGRDLLGDDAPADELNHAPGPGAHFGFPHCHAGHIVDPEFGDSHTCDEFGPPAQKLHPHAAALGMRFYTGTRFPAQYHQQIFIAEHGSWNSTVSVGYRITNVFLDPRGKATHYSPFAEGWLQKDGKPWGRPVDVINTPDGALLVSDDQMGAIYRISYDAPS